nr:hypothetical protein [Pseudomonas chengduensis]
MNAQAGDIEHGFLRQQEHLAPLPIPTGQSPQDLMNIIWRKNLVYLDIGSFAMGAGWMTLHAGTFLFIAISVWVAASSSGVPGVTWGYLGIVPLLGAAIMGPLWYFFIKQWRKPLTPPLRFNRQRREVCVTEPDGNYWFVPWERVHAVSPSALSLNTGGASKQGVLILWLPLQGQEHEAYAEKKPGWVMMLNTGGGIGSMAQWECIRSFMEIGPDAVPENSLNKANEVVQRGGYLGMWKGVALQLVDELQHGKFAKACMTFLGLTIFGIPWLAVLDTRKLAKIPDLTAPEVVEWSKTLPPKQWAKRSPELERAIAEREAELAASSAA